MIRAFFAMVWNPEEGEAEIEARSILRSLSLSAYNLRPRFDRTGLVVVSLSAGENDGEITLLSKDADSSAGAVFGLLFRSTDPSEFPRRLRSFQSDEVRAIETSAGSRLLRSFWGSYIAFIPSGKSWMVVPDPAASIPCFYASQAGVTLMFSHLEHCDFLDRSQFSINFSFLSRLLVYDRALNGETGLNEVREVLPGQVLAIRPLKTECTQAWDPRKVAAERLDLPIPGAARLLEATTRHVVSAWGSESSSVAVSLSGGLDSSIVLACLAAGGASDKVLAIHQRLGSEDPPEVAYAAEAARAAGCALVEVVIPAGRELPSPASHPLSVRPQRQFADPDLTALFGDLQAPHPAAIFTGQGGDHLFLHTRSPNGFSEFVRNRGLHPALFRELMHAARLSGLSVWAVLEASFRPQDGQGAMLDSIRRKLPGAGSAPLVPDDWIPGWAGSPAGLPRGKFEQINRLVHLFQLREPMIRSQSTDIIHPLISQPLIELCLRLPVYTLTAGGISRGLARLAFRDAIPDSIRRRMTKGHASGFFAKLISANSARIREALTAGALSEAGLADGDIISRLLQPDRYRIVPHGSRLLSLYAAEAWLGRWQAEIRRNGQTSR